MKYRGDIDGLRSVAILLVTVFHFDLFSVGKAGFIGVDVFFVISGFLITSIIVQHLREDRFSMGHFLYRRIRRLYPALMATLLIYVAVGYFFFLPDMFQEMSLEALLSQLYVVNFYFWKTVNYFGLQVSSVPLLHMWSLSVEEQFYLLFPAFCLLIHKARPAWLFPAIAVAALGSFMLGYVVTPMKPWAAFYLLPTRAWELLLGSLLAMACQNRRPQGAWLMLCGPVGLALIAAGIFIYTPATPVPGWFALLPSCGAIFLLLGGFDQNAPVTRLLSLRPMIWVGLISYPLYLVHWPVLILIKENVTAFTLPWKLFGFGSSFLLAWMIYGLVERPIKTGRWFQEPRRFMAAFAASSAVLITATALIFGLGGLPQRFSPQVNQLLAYQSDSATAFQDCQDRLGPIARPCTLGDPGATPDMLVIGDSHANAYAQAIDLWLARTGRSALFSFAHSCLPITNMGNATCDAQIRDAIAMVRDNPTIKTAMLISIWRQPYEQGILHAGNWVSGAAAAEAFAAELQDTVRAFIQNGVEVMLIEPFFDSPGNVPRTLAKNLAYGRDWPLTRTRADYDATFARLFEAFDNAGALGAKRVSLIGPFCTDGICNSVVEGRPVFSDNNHLASWMSPRISEVFEATVPQTPGLISR